MVSAGTRFGICVPLSFIMKICIISTLFRPFTRSGAEVVAERVVDGFIAQAHHVVVITSVPFSGLHSLWPCTDRVRPCQALTGSDPVNTYRFFPLNIWSFHSLSKLPAL